MFKHTKKNYAIKVKKVYHRIPVINLNIWAYTTLGGKGFWVVYNQWGELGGGLMREKNLMSKKMNTNVIQGCMTIPYQQKWLMTCEGVKLITGGNFY